jgi:glycosyltransferase involved in cell wall biosynthesis
MLKVTMWLVVPSFYQGDLLRALVATDEIDLQVIFSRQLSEDRIQLGWENDVADYPFRFLEERNRIMDAVRSVWLQPDRIHIVNGMWMEPSFAAALTTLALRGGTYAVYSEAPDPNIFRSGAKRLLTTLFGRFIVGRASGYFPVSHLGEQFFKGLGARKENIYPYGYFRAHPSPSVSPTVNEDENRIEIIYIGQIVHRKGVDVLLEALRPLFAENPAVYLSIIGTGDLTEDILDWIGTYKLNNRVFVEGVMPSHRILSRLGRADLLVLPSRWDGWGVVVNEAFAAGVPVVVSDRCGASELVFNGINGYVFRSEDVSDLRGCIQRFLHNRSDWARLRNASAVMASKISAEAIAPYFIGCLKHMVRMVDAPPRPPWMEVDEPYSAKTI